MRIGYVQFAPVLGDIEANRLEACRLLLEAPPAELLVLPELSNSGYHFASAEEARLAGEPADGKFVRMLQEVATNRGTTIVAGLCEAAGDALYNSAVLVTPDGRSAVYRKLHLFLDEKDLFQPGDLGLPVIESGGLKIGMLICFDWRFPEVWRVLALRGVDVICHPSNLVVPGLAQRSVPIHALINGVYVVTANRIGAEGDLTFTGRSIIASPRGEVLAEGPVDAASTLVVEIDPALARNKSVTRRNDLLADRRPEHYGDLVS